MHIVREHQQLTPELLRTFKGFENITDEKAEHIIDTLNKLARISFKAFFIMNESNNKQQINKAA